MQRGQHVTKACSIAAPHLLNHTLSEAHKPGNIFPLFHHMLLWMVAPPLAFLGMDAHPPRVEGRQSCQPQGCAAKKKWANSNSSCTHMCLPAPGSLWRGRASSQVARQAVLSTPGVWPSTTTSSMRCWLLASSLSQQSVSNSDLEQQGLISSAGPAACRNSCECLCLP